MWHRFGDNFGYGLVMTNLYDGWILDAFLAPMCMIRIVCLHCGRVCNGLRRRQRLQTQWEKTRQLKPRSISRFYHGTLDLCFYLAVVSSRSVKYLRDRYSGVHSYFLVYIPGPLVSHCGIERFYNLRSSSKRHLSPDLVNIIQINICNRYLWFVTLSR